MEILAMLLTCYCHLLTASWVPHHTTETFQTLSQNSSPPQASLSHQKGLQVVN